MLKLAQIVAAAAVVALFLSVAGIAYLSSPPSGNPSQQQSAAETKNSKKPEEKRSFRGFVSFLFPDSISLFTFWLMLATIILGIVAVVQIGYLRRSETISTDAAKAAKDSADLARDTLIASHRAWVKIEQASITGPLAFKSHNATTAIAFRLSNVGNAPALQVQPHAWLLVQHKDMNPFDEQKRQCDNIKNSPMGIGVATIFPGEIFPDNLGMGGFNFQLTATAEEVEKGMAVSEDKKRVSFWIVGCVDYTFPTDTRAHHQTRFVFQLLKNIPEPITSEDGSFSQNGLRLIDMGIGRSAD